MLEDLVMGCSFFSLALWSFWLIHSMKFLESTQFSKFCSSSRAKVYLKKLKPNSKKTPNLKMNQQEIVSIEFWNQNLTKATILNKMTSHFWWTKVLIHMRITHQRYFFTLSFRFGSYCAAKIQIAFAGLPSVTRSLWNFTSAALTQLTGN